MQATTDCRDSLLGTKCKLGMLGCANVQISGQPASNIKASFELEQKECFDVPALGPGQYDLVVIGDQPTGDDDRKDIPFQDKPSDTIISYLEKAGFDLSRVYMTKIVKCASYKKRKPTVSEVNKCRDEYLRKEIELIQPKAVILVGANSQRAFNLTGRGKLNNLHGRVFEEKFAGWDAGPTFKVIPTLNPATFFYKPNERLKARIGHDYVVAKNVIDGIPPTPHFTSDWTLIDSDEKLDWLVEQIEQTNLIGFDTESPTLNYRKCPLLSIQIAWAEDKVAVIPINRHDPDAPKEQEFHILPAYGKLAHKKVKAALKRIFEKPKIDKAAHNIKYDLNVLRWHYGIRVKGFLYDTLILKHLMDENPPSDLEFCCDLEYSWGDYSEARRKITGSGKKLVNTFDKVTDAIMWPYGATDALGGLKLKTTYVDRMLADHPNLWKLYVEESEPLLRAMAKLEYKGSITDDVVMDALEVEWQAELDSILVKSRAITWPDFNPSSNPQVIKAFKNLGIADIELEDESAAGGYSANKKKLQAIQESHTDKKILTLAEGILTFRNRRKMISTYLVNAREDKDADGRLRYSFRQAGPVTGRQACSFLHQIPKIDEVRVEKKLPVMRDMFIVPKGFKYVYGDYSQVELWVMAIESNDSVMLEYLHSGGDLHAATSVEFLSSVWPGVTEDMISKFNRTEVGKRINFGMIFGSEGYSLVRTGKWKNANEIEKQFTWDMIHSGMSRWKKRFTGVGAFIDNTPDRIRANGSVATSVFGRERHFGGELNHEVDWIRDKAGREAINYEIQSPAAALTFRLIIAVDTMLEKFNISEDDICLINTVHDSVAYEVKDYLVDWFQPVLKQLASVPVPQLSNHSFKMDVGVGQNWTLAEMAA